MESKKDKPDGFVAWHEEESFIDGSDKVFKSHELVEDVLLDVFGHGYGIKGWRIRPVKLVFLDEEEHGEG